MPYHAINRLHSQLILLTANMQIGDRRIQECARQNHSMQASRHWVLVSTYVQLIDMLHVQGALSCTQCGACPASQEECAEQTLTECRILCLAAAASSPQLAWALASGSAAMMQLLSTISYHSCVLSSFLLQDGVNLSCKHLYSITMFEQPHT